MKFPCGFLNILFHTGSIPVTVANVFSNISNFFLDYNVEIILACKLVLIICATRLLNPYIGAWMLDNAPKMTSFFRPLFDAFWEWVKAYCPRFLLKSPVFKHFLIEISTYSVKNPLGFMSDFVLRICVLPFLVDLFSYAFEHFLNVVDQYNGIQSIPVDVDSISPPVANKESFLKLLEKEVEKMDASEVFDKKDSWVKSPYLFLIGGSLYVAFLFLKQ